MEFICTFYRYFTRYAHWRGLKPLRHIVIFLRVVKRDKGGQGVKKFTEKRDVIIEWPLAHAYGRPWYYIQRNPRTPR